MRFTKKIRLLSDIITSKIVNQNKPLVLVLKVTNKCNLSCKYCNQKNQNIQSLPLQKIEEIVNEVAKDCAHIIITGGEPTLHPNLPEIINFIKSKDIIVSMVSNGTFEYSDITKLRGLHHLVLSIDSLDEKYRLRLSSKRKILKIIKEAKRHNIKVLLNCVINKQNANHIEDLLKISKEWGCEIAFQPLYEYNFSSKSAKDYALEPIKFKQVISMLIDNKLKYPIFNSNSVLTRYLSWPTKGNIKSCAAGKLMFHIEPNGDVYPCQEIIGKYKPKNIYSESFSSIYRNMKAIRNCWCWCYTNLYYNDLLNLNISTIKETIKRKN
jgi:MoaA/NifB/PqqE/SkfB family radical SAM enzyme